MTMIFRTVGVSPVILDEIFRRDRPPGQRELFLTRRGPWVAGSVQNTTRRPQMSLQMPNAGSIDARVTGNRMKNRGPAAKISLIRLAVPFDRRQ